MVECSARKGFSCSILHTNAQTKREDDFMSRFVRAGGSYDFWSGYDTGMCIDLGFMEKKTLLPRTP
jgi:hypothetical protein